MIRRILTITYLLCWLAGLGAQEVSQTSTELKDSMLLELAISKCGNSPNRGKSVGVLGGSLAAREESQDDKDLWRRYLNMEVNDYAIGGYGYSSLQGSIQDQADQAKVHDIYVLWCSTNDYMGNRQPGLPTDYTEADGFDESKSNPVRRHQLLHQNLTTKESQLPYLPLGFPDVQMARRRL